MLLWDPPATGHCMLRLELKQLSFICELAVLVSSSSQSNLFLHHFWLAWLVFRTLRILGLLLLPWLLHIHVIELLREANILVWL